MIVSARAPTRISFAGGGTDVEPFASEHGGTVINAAIAKYNFVTVASADQIRIFSPEFLTGLHVDPAGITYDRQLDLLKAAVKLLLTRPAELSLFSEVKYRSGLGSSGSAFVAVIAAVAEFCGRIMPHEEKAELAWRIEREELGNLGGRQDQYAAAYGGINYLEFDRGEVLVNNLNLRPDTLLELQKRLVLVYVTPRGASGGIIESQTQNVRSGKAETIAALQRSRELAREMKNRLIRKDVNGLGDLLAIAWQEKKRFAEGISNPVIDEIYEGALRAGAMGGKVSGAGGGGYMFFLAAPRKELSLYKHFDDLALHPEFVKFDFDGSVTWKS